MFKSKLKNENYASGSVIKRKVIRVALLLLFILSFLSIYMGLALVSATTNYAHPTTENMWLYFVPLPIPLASLILGIIYKKKGFKATKNIVVGIIFSVSLIIYGSFTFIYSDFYSHDFSYVNQVMLYNISLKTYNAIPEKAGSYQYLFIAYNSRESTMKIIEYTLMVRV